MNTATEDRRVNHAAAPLAAVLHSRYSCTAVSSPDHGMEPSLDFSSLRRAYAGREATPTDIARELIARIAGRGDDAVWISRLPDDLLLAEAAALERRAKSDGFAALPLYGIPFAVKDNIDVAGLPTTAACPGFAHMPTASAPVVNRLLRAGALFVGKTNLDQFATGLVGTRSPYGVPRNPFDPAFIPGGSSSGSAVAVAAGLVSFALGTDTAGSGRVPAAFNNVVGLKPSRGLIGTEGVVPACTSLDCVSIFALTVADAASVLDTVRDDPDPTGPLLTEALPARFRFGVPRQDQREFFGNTAAAALFEIAIARLSALGGDPREIDLAPFLDAGDLVYGGPFLLERCTAIDAAIGNRRDLLHPITRQVLAAGEAMTAADVDRGRQQLARLQQEVGAVWREVDLLLLPTTGTTYRIDEIAAEPLGRNALLGRYTSFTNPLDLAAVAVPNGFQPNGLPAGVSLHAPAFHDPLLAAAAAAFAEMADLPLGATGARLPRAAPIRGWPGFCLSLRKTGEPGSDNAVDRRRTVRVRLCPANGRAADHRHAARLP
jgi:allophanate hydrolase